MTVTPVPDPPAAEAAPAKPAKRELILDAATRVFARSGFHGARVSDIAAEAGIAYGLVYHYFTNKDEILRTIFEERWSAFLAVVEGIAGGTGSSAEKLHALAGLVLYAYRRRPDWVKVLVFEIQRSSRFSEPDLMRAVRGLFDATERVVRAGQEAGELRRDLEPRLVSRAFIGALETMITSQVLGVLRGVEASESVADDTINGLVELFLGGLRAKGPA